MTGIAPSVLDPAGPQAAHISQLWWLMFWVSTAVFVLVLGFLFAAFVRGSRTRVAVTADRTLTRAVAAAAIATTPGSASGAHADAAPHRADQRPGVTTSRQPQRVADGQ